MGQGFTTLRLATELTGHWRSVDQPQNRVVSFIVSGVTSGDATATVSNGNGYFNGTGTLAEAYAALQSYYG